MWQKIGFKFENDFLVKNILPTIQSSMTKPINTVRRHTGQAPPTHAHTHTHTAHTTHHTHTSAHPHTHTHTYTHIHIYTQSNKQTHTDILFIPV